LRGSGGFVFRVIAADEYRKCCEGDDQWSWFHAIACQITIVVTDVAGDHDLKSEESTAGDFGAPHCSYFYSYSSTA
jgi:hypothetical protein